MSSKSVTPISAPYSANADPVRRNRALNNDSPVWSRIVIALIVFLVLMPLALSGSTVEYAFMSFINQPTQHNELLDYLMNAFSYQKLITSVPLVAGICAI